MQPVFSPKPGDVERKLADTFPNEADRAQARRILTGFDPGDWSVSPDRVLLAALYMCRGSVTSLANWITTAKMDFRDVIAPAEYTAYITLPLDASDEEKQQAIDADWERYTAWVGR